MLSEKILMKKTSRDACDEYNKERLKRYHERQQYAHNRELNFRQFGFVIGKHTMQNMHKKYPNDWHGAKCLCCGLPAHSCICKIEIHDSTGKLIKVLEC